ncbi:phosphatidate cytidylyltransferase [Sulfurimonas gotlandica GD1]|uniref:Phosphatidate cytidylyltransferase n=1 Tax=Sulfurimonas gotlandica (strain DSM 19862 / JCM 16533 / GD1) TaxID=929558 RepID=B6BH86_SULGG|nr:phosphatidate cytidylyltransferase [Sulfurimonas gotlandica]EDZ63744.1 phosphatidate cytidylyltransferase [Sulfurimonas gotlandica GD1]EHP29876.1 phosphatidate cytidylyltransferase [Sulfurimonas gotlandica GD1]
MGFLKALTSSKERTVTGLSLIAVVLIIGFIDNFFLMWAVLGAVYLVAFGEAVKLFQVEKDSLTIYAVGIWLLAGVYPYGDDLFVLAGVAYASAVAFDKELKWNDFFPFIYPTAGMLFIFTMYQEYGVLSLLWLLVVVAMTDVGAYAVGKSIGKTPFCETSPNKTMEGVVGGIIVATFSGMFVGLSIVDLGVAFIISFMVATSSIFGDLFESSLKRAAGVKDSGDILPGHGGALDRIDGYLFGAIVMLVLLRGLV